MYLLTPKPKKRLLKLIARLMCNKIIKIRNMCVWVGISFWLINSFVAYLIFTLLLRSYRKVQLLYAHVIDFFLPFFDNSMRNGNVERKT